MMDRETQVKSMMVSAKVNRRIAGALVDGFNFRFYTEIKEFMLMSIHKNHPKKRPKPPKK